MAMEPRLHVSYLQHLRRSAVLSLPSKNAISELLEARKVTKPARKVTGADYISWQDLRPLITTLNQNEPRGWAGAQAQAIGIAAHGPLGFAALSADTLATALSLLAQHVATRANLFSLEVHHAAECIELRLSPLVSDSPELFQLEAMLCGSLLVLIESMLEVDTTKMRVTLRQEALLPEAVDELLDEHQGQNDCLSMLAGMPVSVVAGDHAALRFPLLWLEQPSLYADELAYRSNVKRCEEQSRVVTAEKPSLAGLIEKELSIFFADQEKAFFDEGRIQAAPTLEKMADKLNLSSRTLIRRLQDEDTSYKSILAAYREKYAAELLLTSDHSVEVVGYLLAYSDSGNFIRAFQEWKGDTPAHWRKKALAGKEL